MRVRSLVKLWNIDIENAGIEVIHGRARRRKSVGNGLPRDVPGTPKHGLREPGTSITGLRRNHTRYALASCLLKHGGSTLPGCGVKIIIPAAQLVHDPIVGSIKNGVPDESVHPRGHARGESGEICCGRCGAPGNGDGRFCHHAGHCSRMSQSLPQRRHPESVNQQNHRSIHSWQRQSVFAPGDRIEATRKHIGKARP